MLFLCDTSVFALQAMIATGTADGVVRVLPLETCENDILQGDLRTALDNARSAV